MKKTILSLVALIAAFTFATPSQAQVKLGVKAGLNVSSVNLKNLGNTLDGKNHTGFFAGATADVTIPLAGLGADISLLYDNRVMSVGSEDGTTNKTLHYVSLPINAKYTFGFSSLASVYVATGPQFSWNVGSKRWGDYTEGWELKKSEFSWNIGAGVTALSHVRIGYNYNIGLGNTAEASLGNIGGKAIKGKLKNNTQQISLTYFF